MNEEERVKDDRFRQCDCQNRLDKNWCESAWIAADCGRRAQTGKAYADAAAHGGEADVNASAHLC